MDDLKESFSELSDRWVEALKENMRLRKRNKELEAALREIVAMTPDPEFGTLPIDSAIKVARAALGENLTPIKTPLTELIEKKMNDGEPPVDWSK
jgi:predicted nuclease with TOPRIM domain